MPNRSAVLGTFAVIKERSLQWNSALSRHVGQLDTVHTHQEFQSSGILRRLCGQR